MKAALAVVLLLAACAPDEPSGPKWYTADEETRTDLPFEDIATVHMNSEGAYWLRPSFNVSVSLSGDASTNDGRVVGDDGYGSWIAEVSPSQWLRVGRAVADVGLFDEGVDDVPSYGDARLSVETTDHVTYALASSTPAALEAVRVIEEVQAELAWEVFPARPLRAIDKEIASLKLVETSGWGGHAYSKYVVRLERNGRMRKTDQRTKGDHERGHFVGEARRLDVDNLIALIEDCDAFESAGSVADVAGSRYVWVRYVSGRGGYLSGGPVGDVIASMKTIADKTEWTPR